AARNDSHSSGGTAGRSAESPSRTLVIGRYPFLAEAIALTTFPLKAGWLSPKNVMKRPPRSYPVKKAVSSVAVEATGFHFPEASFSARWGRKKRRRSSIGNVPGRSFS